MKKKNEQEKSLRVPFHGIGISMADPMGSYTGIPITPDEDPVQDADDL